MKAIILAGGKGTRLSSVIPDLPKPLAPVQGEHFLFILARFLRHHGFRGATVSIHHLSEKFEEALPGLCAILPEAVLAREPSPLGTGGAVRFACKGLHPDSFVLVMNGDTFFDFDLAGFTQKYGTQTALALKIVEDASRYGTVELADGLVKSYVEKKPERQPGVIYAGYCIVNVGQILRYLPEVGASSLEMDFFPRLLSSGHEVRGEIYPGRFIDIGVPHDYQFANTKFDFSKFLK